MLLHTVIVDKVAVFHDTFAFGRVKVKAWTIVSGKRAISFDLMGKKKKGNKYINDRLVL
jgi:hypothetical protein